MNPTSGSANLGCVFRLGPPCLHRTSKIIFGIKPSNIGHVSIETKYFYASYWPDNLTLFNKLNQQPGSMNNIIDIDMKSEGRPPEHVIDLHSLDIDAMNNSLDSFQKNNKYHLIGSNKVFNSGIAHSCSSLAYTLLKDGGIWNFAERPSPILKYVFATPNNVANLVLDAKITQSNSKSRLKP